jgi:hypothetical protein
MRENTVASLTTVSISFDGSGLTSEVYCGLRPARYKYPRSGDRIFRRANSSQLCVVSDEEREGLRGKGDGETGIRAFGYAALFAEKLCFSDVVQPVPRLCRRSGRAAGGICKVSRKGERFSQSALAKEQLKLRSLLRRSPLDLRVIGYQRFILDLAPMPKSCA